MLENEMFPSCSAFPRCFPKASVKQLIDLLEMGSPACG